MYCLIEKERRALGGIESEGANKKKPDRTTLQTLEFLDLFAGPSP